MPVYAATIFLSAFLLFLVQPLIAKQLLPWFGGSASVWNTCLVFFQALLLAGYAYADWLTRAFKARRQALVHAALLAASLLALPVAPDAGWKPAGDEDPAWRILGLLFATVGLPYFLLASTSPLLQAWAARAMLGERVYRLFALSNFGSLLALLAYPFLIEPATSTRAQALAWSAGYAGYAALAVCAAWMGLRSDGPASAAPRAQTDSPGPPSIEEHALWLVLPALASLLLLAVTNHITQNIASIPLLWIAPLVLYLLSFILCFEGRSWYRRGLFLGFFAAGLVAMAWGLQAYDAVLHLKWSIPIYCAGLFVACMVLHGELARVKPAPRYLTRFYLMLSLGGALGGFFVGIVAPRVFPAEYEFPLGLIAAGLGAAWAWRSARPWVPAVALAASAGAGYYAYLYLDYLDSEAILQARNFYGTLRLQETSDEGGEGKVRRLMHGVIMHGKQYLDPARRGVPTTYYGRSAGIGRLLDSLGRGRRRVGVVGLGAGTLAAYGRAGDVFRFYDINPLVIDIARREFFYLADSAARVETVLGDARLALEREPPQSYDALAIDAFSSDAIPVHLMTRESLALYLKHLKPQGVIAFHVTNRYLDLAPVVRRLADESGLQAVIVQDDGALPGEASSDWVLVSKSRAPFRLPLLKAAAGEIDLPEATPLWTDDYNNLYRVLR